MSRKDNADDIKGFSVREIKYLQSLPAVEHATRTRIEYTEGFRVDCLRRYMAGESPAKIFRRAGLDSSLIGYKRIERCISRWKKMYHLDNIDRASHTALRHNNSAFGVDIDDDIRGDVESVVSGIASDSSDVKSDDGATKGAGKDAGNSRVGNNADRTGIGGNGGVDVAFVHNANSKSPIVSFINSPVDRSIIAAQSNVTLGAGVSDNAQLQQSAKTGEAVHSKHVKPMQAGTLPYTDTSHSDYLTEHDRNSGTATESDVEHAVGAVNSDNADGAVGVVDAAGTGNSTGINAVDVSEIPSYYDIPESSRWVAPVNTTLPDADDIGADEDALYSLPAIRSTRGDHNSDDIYQLIIMQQAHRIDELERELRGLKISFQHIAQQETESDS